MTKNVTLFRNLHAVNIPNLFTMCRILLVPVLFLCLYYQLNGKPEIAVWTKIILVAIILSDFLDGFLARLLDEESVLGSILDPLADKLFVFTSYIILAVFQKIPAWLSIIVVAKDILVVIGWLIVMLLYNQTKVNPSMLGKTATAFQFFTVCGIIFLPDSAPVFWLFYLTGMITVAALIQYGFRLSVYAENQT